ncbi:DUF1116 domain-containing protein [Pigmentiphaga sp. H8]|uniref:DUF1116 domain-containing protein n=1 Tax=unclassified Pigmentiphaga TaxID=2626614 RepID=UPI000F5A0D15|nr:DUF1116 domain-containing protein [Pigmentiphaga sp. H8]AZG08811.1 DUF1116 domain-containing protein [Pigmentiphaga sp. H8]
MNAKPANQADAAAFAAMMAVRPVLTGLLPAASVFDYPERTLLHAGPPFADMREVPEPVLNSAVNAALFEGWAQDRAGALYALRGGQIALRPAQDFHCVVPLAGMLSPSQMVQVVDDQASGRRCFAPLNGGNAWPMRLGLPRPEVVQHLRWLNGAFADKVRAGCESGLDLLAIADLALSRGDDCHGRTAAGTAILAERLRAASLAGEAEQAWRYLDESPGFFLNLWMAAAKLILSAAEGVAGASLVTAMGGNGVRVGIQVAGRPGTWITQPALPPRGTLAPGHSAGDALPAIGDSAVVEALGLGGMAISYSPEQQRALAAFMPEPSDVLAASLLMGPHPAMNLTAPRMGLSARKVADTGKTPVVALGILDVRGLHGRLGGGIWQAAPDPFLQALSHIQPSNPQGESL